MDRKWARLTSSKLVAALIQRPSDGVYSLEVQMTLVSRWSKGQEAPPRLPSISRISRRRVRDEVKVNARASDLLCITDAENGPRMVQKWSRNALQYAHYCGLLEEGERRMHRHSA
jgi:hypothetical protein